jgi:hypothetical protein
MPARGLLALALGLLAVAVAGCPLPGEEGANCIDDSDCNEAEHLGCWLETCQRLSSVAGPLAFEVVPRTSRGLGPATFVAEDVDRTPVELGTDPFATVAGTVELPGDVPVDVEAVAATRVPGLEWRLATTLPADPWAQGPRPFSLALPVGEWRLRFTSRDGASPPLAATVAVQGRTAVPELQVSPAGRYVRELPFRLGPGPLGHCGASLQGFDPGTGEPITAKVEARGDGASCPDPVLVALVDDVEATLDFVLRVRPATRGAAVASQDLFFRSHPGGNGICPPDVDPPCPATATVDLLPPDGDHPPFLAPVRVVLEAADGAALPPNAVERVVATGLLDGLPRICDPLDPERCGWGQGLAPATFSAREEGPGPEVYLPLLLPGRYGFRVYPRASTDHAVTEVAALYVDPAEPVTLRLDKKRPVTGAVSFEGRPLRALVRAEPVDHPGRTASVEAGEDGRFNLALDPGPYRLEVRPRDPSAPWAGVDLPADGPSGSLQVAVPPRARVRGRVVDDGRGVAGALVRAYRCTPDCTSPGATAVAVGEAVTGAEGSFAMLVPGSRGTGALGVPANGAAGK